MTEEEEEVHYATMESNRKVPKAPGLLGFTLRNDDDSFMQPFLLWRKAAERAVVVCFRGKLRPIVTVQVV
jgi:hypothetical protein